MPELNSEVKFIAGAQNQYDALLTKDPNTVYFCTDTRRIYVGDTAYNQSGGAGGPGIYVGNDTPDESYVLWIDENGADPVLKYHDGDGWKEVSSKQSPPYVKSATPPSDTGTFWIDTANSNILKFYNGSDWVPVPAVWG